MAITVRTMNDQYRRGKYIKELQKALAAVAGTVSAGLAVIVDASKNITGINNLTMTGLLYESALDTISAAGTTQGTATALTKELNRVTVCAANAGVSLPASLPGLTVLVVNHAANAMKVYGAATDKIDDVATATGVSQMVNSVVIYSCYTAGDWYTEGLATGWAPGGLQTLSFNSAVVAFPTGGQVASQGSAPAALTGMVNNVITVATAGDGVVLPAATVGVSILARNAGVASMQVFGAGTDTINSVATATGVPQDPNTSVTYDCFVAGNWIGVPDASKPGQFKTASLTAQTFAAGQLTGAGFVNFSNTNAAPGTLTTRTATQMFNDTHNAQVGSTYMLMITNTGAGILTMANGVGVTITGTLTLAAASWRMYSVTFNSATTMTFQNLGTGTFS